MPLADLLKATDREGYEETVLRDMPAYPGLTLTSHVLLKNVQVGSSLGTVVALAQWLRGKEPGVIALLTHTWPRYAGMGGAAGIVTAGAMMYYKAPKLDQAGLEDRAYRLVLNKGVQAMDFYTAVGGVTTLLVGFAGRKVSGGSAAKLMSPWSLMAQGIATGSFIYAVGAGLGFHMQKPLEMMGNQAFVSDEENS